MTSQPEISYYLENYPHRFPAPPLIGGCRVEDYSKSGDAADTWSGMLIGPKEDVIATLAGWGTPRITVTLEPLTPEEARTLVDAEIEAKADAYVWGQASTYEQA